jgi:hypothetical protein
MSLKPSHVVWLAVAAAAIVGFFVLGHQATKTSKTVAQVVTGPPALAGAAVAESNVQQAAQAMETYRTEHGSYAGASAALLRTYDAGISATVVVRSASDAGYCLQDTVHGSTASATGPTAIVQGPCP